MTTNTNNNLKDALEAEKLKLIEELSEIAKPSATNPKDWTTTPGDTQDITMREEVGDRLEDNATREATEKTLEKRFNEVMAALERIENDTYGKCEVCQGVIEGDRLEANPAATTCKAHMNG